MPINEEITVRMDNRPGSLGKVCHALADRGVNILAFQSIPAEKTILVCMVVDTPAAAVAILDKEGMSYTEGEIVQAKLPHGPGELARAASKLGDANINILRILRCGASDERTIGDFWSIGSGPCSNHSGSDRRCRRGYFSD